MKVGAIEVAEADLRAFCQKWRITEFAVFGSVLREDFSPESDVDVLVTFEDGARWRYEDIWDMKLELAALFGREVDVAQRKLVETDENWLRRQRILESARTLYAA